MWTGFMLFLLGGISFLVAVVWSAFEGRLASVEEDVFKGHPLGWGILVLMLVALGCILRGLATLRLVRTVLPTAE